MKTPEQIREAVELLLWAMVNTPSTFVANAHAIGVISGIGWAAGGVTGAPADIQGCAADTNAAIDATLKDIRRAKAKAEAHLRN